MDRWIHVVRKWGYYYIFITGRYDDTRMTLHHKGHTFQKF